MYVLLQNYFKQITIEFEKLKQTVPQNSFSYTSKKHIDLINNLLYDKLNDLIKDTSDVLFQGSKTS